LRKLITLIGPLAGFEDPAALWLIDGRGKEKGGRKRKGTKRTISKENEKREISKPPKINFGCGLILPLTRLIR